MRPLPNLLLLTGILLTGCNGEPAPLLLDAPARGGSEPTEAWPGFTLIAPLQSHHVYLVDMAGEAVHSWETAARPGVATYLTERGTLLKCQRVPDHPIFQDEGGHGGWIQELDATGEVVWDFRWDGEHGLCHHDIEELPNGNVLLIAWDRRTREEGLALGRDPELLAGEEFWGLAVHEVRPTRPEGGEVVWSWYALDHLVQDHDPELPGFGRPYEQPWRIDINGDRDPDPPDEEEKEADQQMMAAIGYAGGDESEDDAEKDGEQEQQDPEAEARRARVEDADWAHTNGIDYNAELDQIALSVRRYDEVWVIDHGITTEEASGPAGDLLYRWGNPFAYGMGEWEKRQLLGQHNVQWVPEGLPGAGSLLVFNNGARPRSHSTVDEWWAPRTEDGSYPRPEDGPWGPPLPDWTYEAPEPGDFFSPFISGAQRLPSGSTLICSGAPGHVFEVAPSGNVLWDWRSPFGPLPGEEEEDMADYPTALFRAERYAADHPGIVALRAAGADIPVEAGAGPATNQYVPPAAGESLPEADEG